MAFLHIDWATVDVFRRHDLTEEQSAQLHQFLSHPPHRPVSTIFDMNRLACVFFPLDKAAIPFVELSMNTVPSQEDFKLVFDDFMLGQLIVLDYNSMTPRPFGREDAHLRLIEGAGLIQATFAPRFDSQLMRYNGHETAWRLFEVIVRHRGHELDNVSFFSFVKNSKV